MSGFGIAVERVCFFYGGAEYGWMECNAMDGLGDWEIV